MPTELKITCDASEYNRTLDDVVQRARKTSATLQQTGDAGTKTAGGLKKGFADLRAELNNTAGGAKKLISSLLVGGGAIGIILAGIASVGKLIALAFEAAERKIKESADLADRSAASVREAAAANAELRSATDGYAKRLGELASSEKLSNAQKVEARKLVRELTAAYGDLGIQLDETTGRITGVDEAIAKKMTIDRNRQISELTAELKFIEANDRQQRELRDTSGVATGIGDWRIGGEETIKAAQAKLDENAAKKIEIRRKLAELRRSDPGKDYLEAQKAAASDTARTAAEARDEARHQQWRADMDAAFESATSNAGKRNNRLEILKVEEQRLAKLQEAYAKAQAVRQKAAAGSAAALKAAAAEFAAEQQMIPAEQTIAEIKRQIAGLDKVRALTVSEAANAGRKELEVNLLIARGEFEKADALRLQQQLKEKGIKLSEEEAAKVKASQQEIAAGNLKLKLAEQARSLRGKSMEQAGRGREFAEEEALRRAAEVKRGKLTEAEAANVKKIAALAWEMDHRDTGRRADLTIRSNSLTERGGFAGGVRMPPVDQVNREIRNYNQQQVQRLAAIESMLHKLIEE